MSDLSQPVIRRFSSRRQPLSHSFLSDRLRGALKYDRIAGYFCGSIIETAGEALETITGPIRIVCNSGLHPQDVATARAAAAAMRQEWCGSKPEELVDRGGDPAKARMARLFVFLKTGRLQVRVLPDKHFGLIHGKAGVITLPDGSQTSFLGSVNESKSAWTINYELLWEDATADAIAWVQEEFEALWNHHAAIPLADFVIEDVDRLSKRTVVTSVEHWRDDHEPEEPPTPAAVFIESPVYRQQAGLWEHQKYFVKLAFDAHMKEPGGARFVLADQVGLGKTVQLAMSAILMALVGDKPILILAPKSLVWQWQGELTELLDTPSAVWTGKSWIDENDVEHPCAGPEGIKTCPRRIGIVPTSRAIFRCDDAELLKTMSFECIVVDEAHNARRQNLGEDRDGEEADPNNLLEFLYDMSTRTKSMLLATATPVQLRPIEAWDLLDVLSRGSDAVLGNKWSRWRFADRALDLVIRPNAAPMQLEDSEMWDWVRQPLPSKDEHRDFELLRRALGMSDTETVAKGSDWDRLGQPDKSRVRQMFNRFTQQHNPFIRRIVRRSRSYLEQTINLETHEPYLKPIEVQLYGEDDTDAIRLPLYLREAYGFAEQFCKRLGARMQGSGFLKTLLLRRVGSTIAAGKATAEKMLGEWRDLDALASGREADDDSDDPNVGHLSRTLTAEERGLLQQFVDALAAFREPDPKYARVLECLRQRNWLSRGCIIFSQYYDSVRWLADQLVADFPGEPIAIYAGSGKSAVFRDGDFRSADREDIKAAVRQGRLRLVLGTDAASEGLNLQRLGSLINLDLPWNPTRLEQRKGRIQRIGQLNDSVMIYNMRYAGSVEDRVHQMLSSRLQGIFSLFGQLPDILEDVWIEVAFGRLEAAERIIDAVPEKHPFDLRYEKIEKIDWETYDRVLAAPARRNALKAAW
jgi:hypothetical protein